METYGKFNPIEEEEMLQFPQHTCHQQPINLRKLYKKKQCQRYLNDEETSSSSSSESSSSSSSESSSSSSSSESSTDSEMEELETKLKRTNIIPKKLQQGQQQQRQWYKTVDLKGVRPQDVKVLVNPVEHVLIVKVTKRGLQQLPYQGTQQSQVLRVIPLPRTICLQKLRVKTTSTGELIVKAPFLFREQENYKNFPKFQQQRGMTNWMPIHDTFKGKTSNIFENPMTKQYNFNRIPQEHRIGCTGQEHTQRCLQTLPITQVIRDEQTGKPVFLVTVNTVGFRPKDIRVRLNTTRDVLIVEAGHRQEQQMQLPWETKQQFQVATKYLRREFTLPYNLDVSKIATQVDNSGLLRIKLPMKKNTMRHTETPFFGQQQEFFRYFY